jgi:hypothetical protein
MTTAMQLLEEHQAMRMDVFLRYVFHIPALAGRTDENKKSIRIASPLVQI